MSTDRPHSPSQRDPSFSVRSGIDPRGDPHQLQRMSWRAEGAQDYPGGALETLLEISQRGRGPRHRHEAARLREIICERLMDDPYVDASEIEVEVSDAQVTLSGTVYERSQRRRAEDLAADVPTVVDVYNRIRVQQVD